MKFFMNEIELLLKRVENKWLKILFDRCKEKFSKKRLISHDHFHHLRTWFWAKELFRALEKNNINIKETDLEKAIIAIFFHDVGMIKTIDKEHGRISREMCELFFKENKLEIIKGFREVLEAIERHSEENYETEKKTGKRLRKDVFSILRASDDLDALGAIGVFRYAEIYFLRKIPIKELPNKVLKNLQERYNNFQNIYGELRQFSGKQKKRFDFIRNFYQDFKKEVEEKRYSERTFSGAIGVFNLLIKYITKAAQLRWASLASKRWGDVSMIGINEKILKNSSDRYVLEFFRQFDKEINNSHKAVKSDK